MSGAWESQLIDAMGADSSAFVGGDSDKFAVSVTEVHLKAGQPVRIQPKGVTAVVGANNVGKSTLLRETVASLRRNPGEAMTPPVVIDNLQISRAGDVPDLVAWFGERSHLRIENSRAVFKSPTGDSIHPSQLQWTWTGPADRLGADLSKLVIFHNHAAERFSLGGAAEMRETSSDPASHPVHRIQDERSTLERLSEIADDTFGRPLTLDSLGRILQLRVGRVDVNVPPVDNVSEEYRLALQALPTLNAQGDGMRAFMGQLLALMTSSYKFVALDEPEAFLHPPQAHALGKQLGALALENDIQVLVATHDRNFLAGLLDSDVDVSVVKLHREGHSTSALQLDAAKVKELWLDPVLKYTNVLDGLFHRAVVLAEGDRDCAYFAASLDAQNLKTSDRDLLFVPTGGKDGMASVARALREVGVPVVASVDLDLLTKERDVQRLVEALGARWTDEMSRLWRIATDPFKEKPEPATVGDVIAAVHAVLDGHESESFSPALEKAVKGQIRTRGSNWSAIKEYGQAAFKGQSRVAFDTLVDLLDKSGVVLVRPGELERLAPEVEEAKGPKWLAAALAAGAHENAETVHHLSRVRVASDRGSGAEAPSVSAD